MSGIVELIGDQVAPPSVVLYTSKSVAPVIGSPEEIPVVESKK